MGYHREHAIIVTAWNEKAIEDARATALRIFGETQGLDARMVSPVIETVANAGFTFLIGPDGSKEGWGTSDAGDTARDEFVEWLRCERGVGNYGYTWAEIQYGDEGGHCFVTRHDRQRVSVDA